MHEKMDSSADENPVQTINYYRTKSIKISKFLSKYLIKSSLNFYSFEHMLLHKLIKIIVSTYILKIQTTKQIMKAFLIPFIKRF